MTQTADGRYELHDVAWGPGAGERYLEFSREMDKYESDRQRFELSMRACENAVRWATIVAVGRGSPTVDLEDISHAIAISKLSFEAAVGGVQQYMREYLEFPKYCDRVLEALRTEGFISDYQIYRRFGGNQRHGFELDRVLAQLKKQSHARHVTRHHRGGGKVLRTTLK